MKERTRYRVSGAVFLIALAVIFLPMLFDGAGVPDEAIPPMPTPSAETVRTPAYDEIVPATDVVARVQALAAEVDEDGFEAQTQTRFGEPVLSAPESDTSVWAVQAGSFAQEDNARQFRQALREAGYEAFISARKDAGRVIYRVAVGPLLVRTDADDMAAAIASAFDVEPRVQAMRP